MRLLQHSIAQPIAQPQTLFLHIDLKLEEKYGFLASKAHFLDGRSGRLGKKKNI